ncbi:uncharacterized protein ACB058_012913 [Synchiropus picturatus]
MGCSSSSAQTVDQEKRPGTKPEETNGDTLMAQNGIIAEDAETIKEQVQLPAQGPSPDASPAVEAEEEAGPAASEAQEQQQVSEELTPSATPADHVEAETKTVSPDVEVSPVEPFQAEEPPEVEAQEAPAEDPAVDTVVPLMKESADVNEPVSAVSAEASPIVGGVEEVVDSAETDGLAPTSAPAEPSEAQDDQVLAVSSAPEEAKEQVIDAVIAVATIPEMPPVSPAPDQPQDKPQSSTEGEEAPSEPVDTALSKEGSEPATESNQEEELAASTVMVPVMTEAAVPDPDTPASELKDSEDSSASASGLDSTPELLSEAVLSTQAVLDKVKKEE